MISFKAQDCLEAWRTVSKHLLNNRKSAFNIVTEINDPIALDSTWLNNFNPNSIVLSEGKRGDRITDVIHTIFPIRFLSRGFSRYELYAHYLKTHYRTGRLTTKKTDRWGTYFLRLISFDKASIINKSIRFNAPHSEIIDKYILPNLDKNQLEAVIGSLQNWASSYKGALYCHLSSISLDSLKPLGNPCLQYIQFSQSSPDVVDMTVVYRNHDYFNKALGNFIGLGQLLKYVCEVTNKIPGSLVCHSIHAYYDVSNEKMAKLCKI